MAETGLARRHRDEHSTAFRKRTLHRGAATGAHDEVYYVLSGHGEVFSGKDRRAIGPGVAAYLFSGETVGIKQVGTEPLALIVAYPNPSK